MLVSSVDNASNISTVQPRQHTPPRVHGAGLDAGVAVNALGGIDVQLLGLGEPGLIGGRVDAVDRAHLNA